jgi:hypothetical protein
MADCAKSRWTLSNLMKLYRILSGCKLYAEKIKRLSWRFIDSNLFPIGWYRDQAELAARLSKLSNSALMKNLVYPGNLWHSTGNSHGLRAMKDYQLCRIKAFLGFSIKIFASFLFPRWDRFGKGYAQKLKRNKFLLVRNKLLDRNERNW